MVAGEAEELETDRLFARDVNWISGAPQGDRLRAGVKIRYRHPEAQATLTCLPDRRGAEAARFGRGPLRQVTLTGRTFQLSNADRAALERRSASQLRPPRRLSRLRQAVSS